MKQIERRNTLNLHTSIPSDCLDSIANSLAELSKNTNSEKSMWTTPCAELLNIFACDISESANPSRTITLVINDAQLTQAQSKLAYAYVCSSLVSHSGNILDLGSHFGMIGHFCSRFTNKKTTLVECNPSVWHYASSLPSKITESKYSSRLHQLGDIFYFYGAVALKSDISTFWLSTTKSVTNSLYKDAVRDPGQSIQVPTFSYESIFNLFDPEFVKLDIEGCDIPIIEDIMRTNSKKINRLPTTMIFEAGSAANVDSLVSRCSKFFKSCIVVCRPPQHRAKPESFFPFVFVNGSVFKASKKLGSHYHIIVSSRETEDLISSIKKSKSLFERNWSFRPDCEE